MDSKKIGTFKQFLKQQKQKKLNEAKVEIQCDFWDSAQVEVMQDLTDQCDGFLNYDTLLRYVKNKFQILGREEPGYDEALLLAHIKDLIFFRHGGSLFTTGGCNYGEDNAEVQAKGLVVGELAKVILDKVLDTIQTSDDPIPGTTSVSLTDKEPRTLVPMTPVTSCDDFGDDEYYDDLPFEHKKVRPVKKFNDYTKMLKESVALAGIDAPDHDACIDYCIKRIKNEVGSLDPEPLLQAAVDATSPQVKARLVFLYVRPMVVDYLSKEGVKLVSNEKTEDGRCPVPEDVFNDAVETLCDGLADDVLLKICNENGVSYAETE